MAQFIVQETEDRYSAIQELQNTHLDAGFTIGAEAANVKTVTIQIRQDKSQNDAPANRALFAYLSDDASGNSIVAVAPDGGWAISTDGLLIPIVASKAAYLVSESDGDVAVAITHAAGAKTMYLVLVMPNGRLVVSGAITFA